MRYGRPRARRRVMSSPRRPIRRAVSSNPRKPKKRTKLGQWAKRKTAARKAGTKAGPRPTGVRRKRRTVAKRKPATRKTAARKPTKRKTAARKPAKRKTAARKPAKRKTARKTTRSRASYKKAARKAARTKKLNAAKRSAAGKKAARTRRRGTKKTTAKRKTVKRKTATKRRGKLTKAQRSAAARKGARTKRRNQMAKRTVSKKRRTYKRKKSVSRRTRKYKTRARKPLGRHKGKRRYVRSGRKRGGKWARHPKRTYATIRRRKRRTARAKAHGQRYHVRKNPIAALKAMVKDGIFTFGGILGIRALSTLLEKNVFNSATFQSGPLASVAPLLGPGVAMLLAALAPKFITGQPKLVQGLQAGATLVMFDAILKTVLKSVDANNTISPYLLPGSGTTVLVTTAPPAAASGWGGYNEYVGSPMGLEVESAMAMDEYVASPQLGMGGDFDVQEALAGNEGNAFETGYAGGTLAKTVFSNY